MVQYNQTNGINIQFSAIHIFYLQSSAENIYVYGKIYLEVVVGKVAVSISFP